MLGQRSRNVKVMPDGPTHWSSARAQTRTGRARASGPGPFGPKNGVSAGPGLTDGVLTDRVE